MENEFIFTAMFAVVWVVLAVASLFTAILYRHKVRNGDTKAINNLRDTLDCLKFPLVYIWRSHVCVVCDRVVNSSKVK